MITFRAISKGDTYAGNHLEYADYLDEDRKIVGEWWGEGAEKLDLAGKVEKYQIDNVRQGRHPETGEKLRQRMNLDSSKARTMFDITFSAPKSVSIMGVLGDDEGIRSAHEIAVKEGLQAAEQLAQTRVRAGGMNENRATENLVFALYHHDTSRKSDPQIHTHAVAFNLTYDPVEKRWKALEPREIFENLKYITEVYRNALARELASLGYEIEPMFSESGKSLGFEIAGIGKELRDKFSQRSKDRDQAIKEFEEKKGRVPTNREIAVLVRASRSDKLIEIKTAALRKQQLDRLKESEKHSIFAVKDRAMAIRQSRPEDSRIEPDKDQFAAQTKAAYDHAKEHLFERVSVAKQSEILSEVLIHSRGKVNLPLLNDLLQRDIDAGKLIFHEGQYATQETLAREAEMISNINRGSQSFSPLGRADLFTSIQASPDQLNAILGVLDSNDRVVAIQGGAGTGKSGTLHAIRQGVEDAEKEVIVLAPTASAVSSLQKDGFTGAMTMARFMVSQRDVGRSSGERVVILDEAGLVGTERMAEFLKVTEDQNSRVLMVGDTRQLRSVEAGDAFRILQKESRMQTFRLTSIFRQSGKYRDAVKALREDPTKGFAKLGRMGAIREMAWRDIAKTVAKEMTEQMAKPNLQGKTRSVLAVSNSWAGVAELTEAIRAQLRKQGILGTGKRHQTLKDLRWTEAQKRDARNYRLNHFLVFHKSTRNAEKGETFRVLGVKDGKIAVSNGEKNFELTKKQAKAFSVFEPNQLEVAKGDKLLLQRNAVSEVTGLLSSKTHSFRNGEIVTVKEHDAKGAIVLEDGRVLPPSYQHFTHGWAVTAQSAQGRTVDSVFVVGNNLNRESFYVAVSRGRESATVFTSDRANLAQSICVSKERLAASELAREKASKVEASRDKSFAASEGHWASQSMGR